MELNWTTFVLELINFFVLIWLLKRLFFIPVKKTIDERKRMIEKNLADAELAQKEAKDLQSRYEGRLQEWESERAVKKAEFLENLNKEKQYQFAQFEKSLIKEREKVAAQEKQKATEWVEQVEKIAIDHSMRFASNLLKALATAELEKGLIAVATEQITASESMNQLHTIGSSTVSQTIQAQITSAFPLEGLHRDHLEAALAKALGKEVCASYQIDPDLLAGVEITSGALVIRANIRDELKFFSEASLS